MQGRVLYGDDAAFPQKRLHPAADGEHVEICLLYTSWAFNLIRPECLASAVVMLIVSIMTSTLTTQLKRQEQMKAEAEKERMRGNLLRAVSHDLRTPLTSIYGACSAMLENYDALPRQTHIKLLSDVCACLLYTSL